LIKDTWVRVKIVLIYFTALNKKIMHWYSVYLIVGLITPHHTYQTIMKTRKGRPRPDLGCSATDDDDDDSVYLETVLSMLCNYILILLFCELPGLVWRSC
jgi:hypothetical protein